MIILMILLIDSLEELEGNFLFTALAKTPTVTMPRIKALMAGSEPNFIDIFRNFESSALQSGRRVFLMPAF